MVNIIPNHNPTRLLRSCAPALPERFQPFRRTLPWADLGSAALRDRRVKLGPLDGTCFPHNFNEKPQMIDTTHELSNVIISKRFLVHIGSVPQIWGFLIDVLILNDIDI